MDPTSIIGLVDASINFALNCAGTAKKINDIASKYRYSRHAIISITQYLDTMRLAWDRIGAWVESYTPDPNAGDEGFISRMARALEVGTFVMNALEKELLPFDHEKMSSAQRMKLIWNGNIINDHQIRIRDQAASMSLLLQAIQLPTPKDRGEWIRKSEKQFKRSDESAHSVIPSRMSISTRKRDSQSSVQSEAIVYRQLSFEDDLFTARVYKRNYGYSPLLRDRKAGQKDILGAMMLSSTTQTNQCTSTTEPQAENSKDGQLSSITANADSQKPFLQACRTGDYQTVQYLLENGHDVHSTEIHPDKLRIGAIHIAVQYGHIDIVKILWLHGASLEDRTTSIGYRPLHIAVKSKDLAMVKLLLRRGAHVSAENQFGEQPIHLAARYGSIKILNALLKAGAELECPDLKGRRPMYCASGSANRPHIIEYLASKGSDINARRTKAPGDRPLDAACRRGHLGNVWTLLQLGAKTSSGMRYGSSPPFKSLLKRNIDMISDHSPPTTNLKLHPLASLNPQELGNIKAITKLLLTHGADVNALDDNGDTALHLIARERDFTSFLYRLTEGLLEGGASPHIANGANLTPLELSEIYHVWDPSLTKLLGKSVA